MLNQSFSLKLSRVIPLGFLTIFSIMVINSILSKLTVNTLTSTAAGVMHSYRVQTSVQELQEILVDIQLGERGFIITRNEEFLKPYNNAKNKLNDKFKQAKELVKDDPAQTKRLNELEKSSQNTIAVLSTNIAKIKNGFTPSFADLNNGKKSLELARFKIQEILKVENDLLIKRQKLVNDAEKFSNLTSLGGMIAGIFLGSVIVLFVIRKVVKPINEVTNLITTSSTEITATVAQQERIASEQSSAVNQTTTTMEELAASSEQAAAQAEEAAIKAKQALALAEHGTNAVDLTLEGMATLQAKVNAIGKSIVSLSQQTSEIGNISNVVTDLANQTNMLALNAAVEAVRAGEQGKGFSVVANEIRRLADRSKVSSEKINTLVRDIEKAIGSTVVVTNEGTKTVQEGVQIAHQTANAFTGVTEAIDQIALNSQQISLSSKQQAAAIQQVASAMKTLEEGAVETANGINQTKIGTQQLNEAAATLKKVV